MTKQNSANLQRELDSRIGLDFDKPFRFTVCSHPFLRSIRKAQISISSSNFKKLDRSEDASSIVNYIELILEKEGVLMSCSF